MARAAVLPPSPVKRGTRTAPRTNVAKATTASSRAKATADAKKRAPINPPAYDSDDTEDELGMMMKEDTEKPTRPRGHVAGRPAAKTTTARGKKAAPAPAPEESQPEEDDEETAKPEPVKKRVGRPRKNPEPAPAKTETAPKTRGRSRAGTTAKTPATRKNTRATTEDDDAVDNADPKHIVIATNSTTMRSNILRGPAKKKTVTFQDVSDSDSEDVEEPARPVAGRKKTPAKRAGKTGLGASPVRKPAATGTRGRKPAAKKEAPQPLSPKKAKQMAKSLSAYASSDGEEDELSAAKDDLTSPVKLVVHSPAKHGSENTGLSSPVRRINFTPKKASSMVDENGEPKLPTPKHGSAGTGLSSPVRRINFTPNRSQQTVTDNGHLALPPGKAIDFSDSVFMSSPAKRPEASPFKFSLRGSQNCGSVLQSGAGPVPTPDFGQSKQSPLKMSPKKGHLGASFSQSPSKASTSTPSFPARTALFQSPAKKVASPFKSSLFPAKRSVNENATPSRSDTLDLSSMIGTAKESSTPKSIEAEETTAEQDLEMVQEVARDIFGIELDSDSKSPSNSAQSEEAPQPEPEAELDAAELADPEHEEADEEMGGDVDEKLQQLQEEIGREPEDFGTVCFSAMEELQAPFKNLPEHEDVQFDNDAESIVEEENKEVLSEDESRGSDSEVEPGLPLADAAHPIEEQEDEHVDVSLRQLTPSSDETLEFAAMEEAQTPVSIRQTTEDEIDQESEQEIEDFAGSIRQPDEELEVESTDDDMQDDEPTLVRSEATILSQPRSPDELHQAEASSSSVPRMGSVPPLAPTPPAGDAPFSPIQRSGSVNRLFDINLDLRIDEESAMDDTLHSIPTPRAPRLPDTPSGQSRRKSNFNVDAGFTPLAQKFDRWEAETPSQDRPAKPRRRGVFSLAGPLEQPAEPSTPETGHVAYPDLSRTPLANTPSLFAELPLQTQSDDASVVSESPAKSSVADQDQEMIDSPQRSEIFEDPEPDESDLVHSREITTALQPLEDEKPELEDKENNDAPFIPPATPMKGGPSPLRTVHTVSKVPLKGEGDISPLKIPRKRGHSLSNASPTRTSPRIRKSMFFPRVDTPPVLAPSRRSMEPEGSPTPKRRCSAGRRTSAKMPVIAPPKSPSVAGSPAKTPRRDAFAPKSTLRGAVVHVDVHTTEGEDASGIFVELLQQMGARCVKSWSWNPRLSSSPVDGEDPSLPKVGITHVVYKDGGLRTLEKVKQASGLVKCVGVGWVLE